MENSSTTTLDRSAVTGASAALWLGGYALALAAGVVVLSHLVAGERWTWSWKGEAIARNLVDLSTSVKLLALAIYLSLACTFVPLNTSAVVAAVALPQARLADSLVGTTLLVALVGAVGSTIANLNDYHLFSLLLRHRRVAAVRNTRLYHASAAWFARAPFSIVAAFSFIPIPVDVIRMLAVTCGYPRLPFAAANLVGRFCRYAALAAITYSLGPRYGWLVIAAVLAMAVVLGAWKFVRRLTARRRPAPAERPQTQETPS